MTSRYMISTAICALAVAIASAAAAQEAAADGPAAATASQETAMGQDDIIVTAQRRASAVREVPFSIAAFRTATLGTPNEKGHYGKTDGYAARGKLLFQPTDTLRIVLAGDHSYTKGNGGAIALGIGGNQVVPATFGQFSTERSKS